MAYSMKGMPPLPGQLDMDALVRLFARHLGIPARKLRTPEECELFRKRREASKRGWITRRAKKL